MNTLSVKIDVSIAQLDDPCLHFGLGCRTNCFSGTNAVGTQAYCLWQHCMLCMKWHSVQKSKAFSVQCSKCFTSEGQSADFFQLYFLCGSRTLRVQIKKVYLALGVRNTAGHFKM